MNQPWKLLLGILTAAAWISASEFLRNTFLLHDYWVQHYASLGLVFPEQPVNGAIWGLWALCFTLVIYLLSQQFSFTQTVALAWVIGFVLMWLVIGNMGVLPLGILPIAIPLSILEVVIATIILRKFQSSRTV